MSERFAAAMGRKMVSRASAEELGELAHIVVDVEHRRIAYLTAGKRRKALLVDWENVSGFGPDAVIVTDESALYAARDDRDWDARPGKGSGEESADRAGPHDRDPLHLKSLKATGRFELPNGAFAEPCLTTWLRRLEV